MVLVVLCLTANANLMIVNGLDGIVKGYNAAIGLNVLSLHLSAFGKPLKFIESTLGLNDTSGFDLY